jgi:hypothetical protein
MVAALIISLVVIYAAFQLTLVLFGLLKAKASGVMRISRWDDVHSKFETLMREGLAEFTPCTRKDLWPKIVRSLQIDNLLTKKEVERLLAEDFTVAPLNKEARRRILHFLSTMKMMTNKEATRPLPEEYSTYPVQMMPSCTVIVPVYSEPIVYEWESLVKRGNRGISELAYLRATYPDEWDQFCSEILGREGNNVLEDCLSKENLDPDLMKKIVIWASLRGQTLLRTLHGLLNIRLALYHLAEKELKEDINSKVSELVHKKFQIIISHQTYDPERHARDFDLVVYHINSLEEKWEGRILGFDLAYDSENNQSILERWGYKLDGTRPNMNDAKERVIVQRSGQLKLGEGKPANQMHALQLALNDVIQVNDMNQYTTFENGLIYPFVLSSFFGIQTPSTNDWNTQVKAGNLVPHYRIVGFPESTYTRPLSHVGELAGAAEFSFVTIVQRVLRNPLRVRGHYGHPGLDLVFFFFSSLYF